MRFLLTIIIIFTITIPASAQWQYGGIPITGYWRTWDLSVRSDGEGGMLLSWSDYRAGSDGKAYVQKVDSSGHALWGEYGINCCTVYGSHINPIAVTDGNGGALVAWWDIRSSGIDKIYGQHISREGNLIWPDSGLMILENEDPNHNLTDVIPDGRGGMIVQWAFPAGVQRVDTSGYLYYGAGGLNLSDAFSWQSHGKLCMSSDSAFIATWIDERGLYGQKFTLEGNRLWDSLGIPVAVLPAEPEWPDFRISPAPNGGLYAFWGTGSGNVGVRLQWVDNRGVPRFGPSGLMVFNGNSSHDVALTTNYDGRALLAWKYYHSPPPFWGYVNIVDTTGTLEWPNSQLLAVGVSFIHGVTQSIPGQFEIGIELANPPYTDRIIKYDTQNGFVWGDSGISYYDHGNSVRNQLISDGVGGVSVGWQWNSSYYIFANRVYPDGWVAPDTTAVVDDDTLIPLEMSISNYPNPFNSSTLITLEGLAGKEVELKIYDIEGRLVDRLNTNNGQILWSARNSDNQPLPSGLYFAKITTPLVLPALKMIYLK